MIVQCDAVAANTPTAVPQNRLGFDPGKQDKFDSFNAAMISKRIDALPRAPDSITAQAAKGTGQPTPAPGGGVDTSALDEQTSFVKVEGQTSAPVREEELRDRFFSFEPLFDRRGRVAARELVLRGRLASGRTATDLRHLDEDVLLTGLYSLVADEMTAGQALLVKISAENLSGELIRELNRINLIWITTPRQFADFELIQELRRQGFRFCLEAEANDSPWLADAGLWDAVRLPANAPPRRAVGRAIAAGVSQAAELAGWPEQLWAQGPWFTGSATPPDLEQDLARRYELLSVALRQPLDALNGFLRLHPDLEAQLLRIAATAAGGLSDVVDSCAHALVRMGRVRAQRAATLVALAGAPVTADGRLYARIALIRALLLGKVTRSTPVAELAPLAFEAGLFSPLGAVFPMPAAELARRFAWAAEVRQVLTGGGGPLATLLQLAHACEKNDGAALARLAAELQLPLETVALAHMEALVVAEDLDSHLM